MMRVRYKVFTVVLSMALLFGITNLPATPVAVAAPEEVNIALNKPATSSEGGEFVSDYGPDKAVNGIIGPGDGWSAESAVWADKPKVQPWLQVDLQGDYVINGVEVVARPGLDGNGNPWYDGEKKNFQIQASNDPNFAEGSYTVLGEVGASFEGASWVLDVSDSHAYRYIRYAKTNIDYAFLTEIKVFGTKVEKYSVSGIIVDENNKPVQGATVKLQNFGDAESLLGTATSGSDGSYVIFPSQPAGKYTVTAVKENYLAGSTTVIISSSAVTNADIKLIKDEPDATVTVTVYAAINNSSKVVTLSGGISSGQGHAVTVEVINPAGGIDYINQDISGLNGDYRFSYTLDENEGGTYQVRVGGTGVEVPERTQFTYVKASTPPDHSGGSVNNGDTIEKPHNGGDTEVGADGVISGRPSYDSSARKALLVISADHLNNAAEKAIPNAKGVKVIPIQVEQVEGAQTYVQEIPASAISKKSEDVSYRIETVVGTITLPGNMLKSGEIKNTDVIQLEIGHADLSSLDASLRTKLGNRPVVEINLKINGVITSWNNPDAPVTVSIPYKPTMEELDDPEHIVVMYIDKSGNGIPVTNGQYDARTGMVTFTTQHLSQYAVAFVRKTFHDIERLSWAKKQIEVLASKGIINGTSKDTYSPANNISRADYIQLLIHTLGLTAKVENNFADTAPEDYYYEALGIAKALGITHGVGNNKFNPNESISRQDMMVLTARALERFKDLEISESTSILVQFSDHTAIADYAANFAAALVKEGLIKGSGTGKVNPAGKTTRAEAAVFLYGIYYLQ